MRSLPAAFGKAVQQLRSEQGDSQEKFAAKAGISRTYMREVERGVTVVSLDTVARLARALGLRMSELLQRSRTAGDARKAGWVSTPAGEGLRAGSLLFRIKMQRSQSAELSAGVV